MRIRTLYDNRIEDHFAPGLAKEPWASSRLARPMATAALLLVLACTGCAQFTAQGYNAEGVRMFAQNNYPGALDRFQRALQEDPQNVDAYYNLGSVYHRMAKVYQRDSDLAQAESYYQQCIDRKPDHADAHRALSVLLAEEGRTQEAFQRLEDWARRSPRNAVPHIELARLSEEFNDKEMAREQLLEAIRITPDDPRARAALGRLYEEAGNYAQAMTNYQASLAQNHYQPELQQRVAALTQAVGPRPFAPAGDTRMVTTQPPALR